MNELEKMREFATRERAVISNGDLSQEGKNQALKRLNDEKLQYKPVAVAGLKATAEKIKKEFKQAGNNINDAIEKRDASWKFDKLNYHAQAVGLAFENVSGVDEAVSLYDGIKNSNDKYRHRVACEIGSGVIGRRFGERSTELRGVMRQALDEMLITDEIKQAQEDGQKMADKLINFAGEVKTVASFYASGFLGGSTEFDGVLSGVRITRKMTGSGENTSVEVD